MPSEGNTLNIIPVLSGKGGVGKSSVTAQLALSLCLRGHSVGVLDIDLTGPSIPRIFRVEDAKVRQAPGGWLPVSVHGPSEFDSRADSVNYENSAEANGANTLTSVRKIGSLHVMSLGFLLRSRGDAIIWRGPKKTAMVGQLLSEVIWPTEMSFLLIDTPPGTSDEHISLVTNLLDPTKAIGSGSKLGAVIVTTPQAISTADVRKELSFCQKVGLKVLGVIENMAGFVCPCCGEITNVFSKGGGQIMAQDWGVKFMGSVPLDGSGWNMLIEEGKRPTYRNEDIDETRESTAASDLERRQDTAKDDSGQLVEKYTSCSLWPIFDQITASLEIEIHMNSSTQT